MNPLALAIIIVGFPLSLLGFFLTRAYCRAKTEQPRPRRASYRAGLFNSITDADLRMASDNAVIASGIVAGTVIHS